MQNVMLKIESNVKVSSDIYKMRLVGNTSGIKNSGEFINIALPGYYLRRPISVCDFTNEYVDILYKVLGHGTRDMSTFEKGMELDCLIGLGNGFDLSKAKKPLLVAGGIGIAPLIGLAKRFNDLGIMPTLIYGARNSADIVLIDELKKYTNLIVTTDDGSLGFKGNTVEFLNKNGQNIDFDYYYACGPMIMLKYLSQYSTLGDVSLEARMGCGFGACMGCSIETTNGPKRVCKEGPIFQAGEVIFK